ncbi:hypothetical protein [Inquilinus sp. CA228]|uniref:hypothetical protein n=1 Tax=Inquilinus sp. CA228 TaxID=3455609 RepID=UPI003F8D50E9
MATDTAVAVEDPPAGTPDHRRADQEQRRKQNQKDDRQYDIHQPLRRHARPRRPDRRLRGNVYGGSIDEAVGLHIPVPPEN